MKKISQFQLLPVVTTGMQTNLIVPGLTGSNYRASVDQLGAYIIGSLAGASGASSVGFARSDVGAATQMLSAILSDGPLTPQAFGAVADGRNCSNAMDAMCTASRISGKSIRLPSGAYGVIRPIVFALSGSSVDSFEGSGIGCQILALPAFVGAMVFDARQVGGRTIRNLQIDCGSLASVIGVDTSWPTVGPSVANIYDNVIVQNHAATAWKAWNDNDTSFRRVTTRGAKTAGLFGIDLTAGGGAISMDGVICADSSISVTCQNGSIEGGYSSGIRFSQNGATGTNYLGINNHQIYCSPTAISSSSPATAGNYTCGVVYTNSNILALRGTTGDNSSYILDTGLNGTFIFENVNFVPPTSTSAVPSPLFRLFGPNFKDQAIGNSKVIIKGGNLNGLDIFCYSGGTPEVILEDVGKPGVGRVNDQQARVVYRNTISGLGAITAGTPITIVPSNSIATGDGCSIVVEHYNITGSPGDVGAIGSAVFLSSVANGLFTPIATTNSDAGFSGALLPMRLFAPTTGGGTPALQVTPNYNATSGSTISVTVTKIGSAVKQY